MRTLLVPIVIMLMLGACASIDSRKKASTFETALFRYSKAIRWSEFGMADSMRRLPEDLPAATRPPGQLEHIRVTGYETLATDSSPDGSEIRVSARIVYYHEDGLRVNSLIDNQIWQYDDEQDTWYITTPLPDFR
jgi:uncharacterized protein YceK